MNESHSGPLALEVLDLESGYAGTTVLRGISLKVERGQVIAVLGANGAGKSTLLKSIAGLVRPTKGSVAFNGCDLRSKSTHVRSRMGMAFVPEGRAVFRSLSVRDNIRVQAARGRESEAIDRVVGAFPALASRLSQVAGTMSGGQQQMLAIGRAYVRDPSLILLDEASLGLAPIIVDDIFSFLATATEAGTSLVVVDQFVDRALEIASHVYVIKRGLVAYSGNSSDLQRDELFDQYMGGGLPTSDA